MSRGKNPETSSARRQILATARELFFRDGYRAVGVDTIVAESGVAKMTLYRHFASKDDLIVAFLDETNAEFWQWMSAVVSEAGEDGRDQLLAIFRALVKMAAMPLCYGCPFLGAATEFPDPTHPGHQVAQVHKNAIRAYLTDLGAAAGAREPAVLADQLLLLIDGAFMSVRMFGPESPAQHALSAATALIDAQVAPAT